MITQQMIDALPTAKWSREDYDKHTALNQTGAKLLIQTTPGHYKAYLEAPKQETEALRVGSLTHLFVLQPDVFTSSVICTPEDAPRKPTKKQMEAKKPKAETLEAISWWSNFEEASKGKTVADRDEYQQAVKVGKALQMELMKHKVTPLATELCLTASWGEIPLKAQLDLVTADGWIWDLKTAREYVTPNNVLRTIYQRQYHLQGAYYMTMFKLAFGFKAKGFRMAFVEKDDPCATASYQLSDELITEGQMLMIQAIEAYRAAITFNSWPLYPDTINILHPRKIGPGAGDMTLA